MSRPRHSFLRLAGTGLIIVAIWMIVALFFGWQHHAMLVARGDDETVAERLSAMAATMMSWAVMTPVVIYLADLFPVRRQRRARNGAIMAGVGLAVACTQTALGAWLPVLLEGMPMTGIDYRASVLALIHNNALMALLLIGVANLLRVEREDAERKRAEPQLEAALAEARVRQLRADLQPHFLFNTFNAVAALLHRDPAAAEQMLHRLRDLLGASMASESTRETALATEIEFLARYLEIQKMRFGAKLSAEIRVAERRLERAAVPPLLLQPLVENSIVHGIAACRYGGRVIIEAEASGPWLCLRVRDNGCGTDGSTPLTRPGSVGVPNARARLESLYGEQQSLTYYRRGDELIAEVRIPLRLLARAA